MLMYKRANLNNINAYIIQICQLYLDLKTGNVGETLSSLLEFLRHWVLCLQV